MNDFIDREALRAAFLAETWRPGQVLGQVLALIAAAPRAATEPHVHNFNGGYCYPCPEGRTSAGDKAEAPPTPAREAEPYVPDVLAREAAKRLSRLR